MYNIQIKKLSLNYDLHYDKSNTLKEMVINFFHKRKFVEEKSKTFKALDNVSLDVHEGERVGIIGLNGSGKSTLLKVISGILKPTHGTINIHGSVQPLIEIGAGFNPEFSGRENIYLNGYMLGFTKSQIKKAESEIIEFSELGQFIDVPVKYYSSGMSVRLAFTIATMIRPEILVFDEMLSAGDAQFIDKAKKRMDAVVKSAKILVLVSHDLELVRTLCNRTIVMSHGKMIYDGPTENAIHFYLTKVVTENRNADIASLLPPPIEDKWTQLPIEENEFKTIFNVNRPSKIDSIKYIYLDRSGQKISEIPYHLSSDQMEKFQNIGTHSLSFEMKLLPIKELSITPALEVSITEGDKTWVNLLKTSEKTIKI